VSGAIALLLNAFPSLSADQQEAALDSAARDLGPVGVDNDDGYGRLDLFAAYQWLATVPDFTVTATPASATVAPGGSTSFAVSTSGTNGFSGDVSLSLAGLSASQAGRIIAPPAVTGGSGTSQLSVTTSSTIAPGSYPLTITGTSGSTTRTATATLDVSGPPDFSVLASPSSQSATAGNGTSYSVTVGALNGHRRRGADRDRSARLRRHRVTHSGGRDERRHVTAGHQHVGNGRTGRILNLLFLVEQNLLDQPVLYLSRAIIRQRDKYYRLLNDVTCDDAWEPWVLYILDAVHDTALWTTKKIKAIRELLRRATAHVRERAPSLYSRELVELVFEQPYSRIGNVVDAGIAKRQTASAYLKQLCDVGVLREVKAGREKLFIHPNLMKLLTAEDHNVPQYPSFANRPSALS
jgi:hypothetical protein